uniref:Binding protein n=1 Tax=Solanum tuberosum TaxID=4113 RepID=M1BRD0_SOLTU
MKTSAAKLIVDALLQRFLPLARRRIETAQAQDGQYLRPSDPAYEQVLDSLAMIARHTPGPLLEALLRWRERPYYNMYQWPTINIEDQQELQQPFEEKEVLDGLKACAVDKAQVQMGTLWGSLFIVGRS